MKGRHRWLERKKRANEGVTVSDRSTLPTSGDNCRQKRDKDQGKGGTYEATALCCFKIALVVQEKKRRLR